MSVDVLILNTATVDYRRSDFDFVTRLAGEGGLAKCPTQDMPDYSQQQLHEWIQQGYAMLGGPGNTAPLLARANVKTAVGSWLGKGDYDGLDAGARYIKDSFEQLGVDVSAMPVHPELPSGATFLLDNARQDRSGIVYFPNANNDFDFELFKGEVERLDPRIIHYMYSGLSERGDANGGRDLTEFIAWCRKRGIVTIVDSHTLAGSPQELIASGEPVEDYRLLDPLLHVLDIFFTSADESKMTGNTLAPGRKWNDYDESENCNYFLNFLSDRFLGKADGTRLFGVTVGNGAYHVHRIKDGTVDEPIKTESRFMAGGVVDLVGAGDSFRAGFLTYLANNLEAFKDGSFDFEEAVQMANLMAALYVKAPLDDRYSLVRPYDVLRRIVRSGVVYDDFDTLRAALDE